MDNKSTLPVVVSVILTKGSKVLLGKRKNNTGAGLLSTPGGRVEFGETILEAASRELKEETGITFRSNDLLIIGFREQFRFGGHYIVFYVAAEIGDREFVNTEPDKCEGWDFYYPFNVDTDATTEPHSILYAALGYTLHGIVPRIA